MNNVKSIRGDDFAPDNSNESVADSLDRLAKDIRAGKISARRGVLCLQGFDSSPTYRPVGEPLTLLEATGLLALSQHWIATEVIS